MGCRCSLEERETPAPGCPRHSIAKRRWINHNSCGDTTDEEEPQYYFSGVSSATGGAGSLRDYDGSPTPVATGGTFAMLPPALSSGAGRAAGPAAVAFGGPAGPLGTPAMAPAAAATSLPYFCDFQREPPDVDDSGALLLWCDSLVSIACTVRRRSMCMHMDELAEHEEVACRVLTNRLLLPVHVRGRAAPLAGRPQGSAAPLLPC